MKFHLGISPNVLESLCIRILLIQLMCLSVAVGPSVAVIRTQRHAMDDVQSDYMWHWLDFGMRNFMREGVSGLGVPPLDPADIAYLPFTWKLDHMHIDGRITNSSVVGATRFILKKVSVDMKAGRMTIVLWYPLLALAGHYNVAGKMFGMDIVGSGPYQLIFHEVTINSTSWFTMNEKGKLQIYRLKQNCTFGSLNVNFENLMGGGDPGVTANEMLSANGPQIFYDLKKKLEDDYNKSLMDLFNSYLAAANARDMMFMGRYPSHSY